MKRLLLVFGLIIIGSFLPASISKALPSLNNLSPNPTNHFETGKLDTNKKDNDIARAFLLRSDHGNSPNGYFDIYYAADPVGRDIRINAATCEGNRAIDVDVTLSGDNKVKNDANICGADWTFTVQDGDRARSLGGFRVRLEIVMTSPKGSPSQNYSVLYRVSAASGQVGYRETLSNKGTNAGIRQVTRADRINGYYGTHRFPFGLTCDAAAQRKTVRVYDADNQVQSKSGEKKRLQFAVFKDDVQLTEKQLYSASGVRGISDTNWVTPEDGSSLDASVDINMEPGAKYELRVRNVLASGAKTDYGHNFFRVGLPGDGIYGAKGFSCSNTVQVQTQVKVLNPDGTQKRAWSSVSTNAQVYDKLRWRHVLSVNGTMIYKIDAATPGGVTTTTAANATKGRWASRTYGMRSNDMRAPFAYGEDVSGWGRTGGIYGGSSLGPVEFNQVVGGTGTGSGGVETATPYTIASTDGGHMLCERYTVTPGKITRSKYGNINTSGSTTSAPTCVTVAASAPTTELTPSVSTSRTGVVQAGETVDVTGDVDWPGSGSITSTWVLNQFTLPAGSSDPSDGGESNSDAAGFFGRPMAQVGTASRSFSADWATSAYARGIDKNLPVGEKVCWVMSVNPYRAGGNWRHSDPVCVVVGKKPTTHIWGGGLIVRDAKAYGTTSTVEGETFGSWVEYGVFSSGENVAIASGSGLHEGDSSSSQSDWSELTYANTGVESTCPSGFGCYQAGAQPNVAAQFPIPSSPDVLSGTVNLNSVAKNKVVTAAEGDTVTLSAAQLNSGQWLVINAPGTDVVINGNLTYDNGNIVNAKDIPQLVIIARNITINHSVSRVDAWLIASGAISTCEQAEGNAATLGDNYDTSGARLTASDCTGTLQVNGPVVTDHLYLRRTAGRPTADEPAEIFNLRPDAYLWAYYHQNSTETLSVTSIKELPPRY